MCQRYGTNRLVRVPRSPDEGGENAMGKRGYMAVETVGLVIGGLCVQGVFRGAFDRETEPLWGAVDWVPGGHTNQLVLLGCVGAVAMAIGVWARSRQKRRAEA
jgi:hypothetical protein